jgi:glutamyl-tRNA reductase
MNLFGISINHKNSSLELREKIHLTRDEIIEFIPRIKDSLFSEGVIISTCNRTEIFGFPNTDNFNPASIINVLSDYRPVKDTDKIQFSGYYSCSAVKHLFSVATGIDSLIIGDSQILGQVKEAFDISQDMNFAGTVLKRIFDTAVVVGKRAIKDTSIGEGAVTVSYAAVQVVEKIFSSLDKKSALVIGAGETGELAAVNLRDKGIGRLAISNRTIERAEVLAARVKGEIIPFPSLKEHLHNFDIIISATSAGNLIISYDDVKESLKKRRGNPVVIMDIAVPRDIDPRVRNLENVFYHDMDSLQIIVDQNLQRRKEQIPVVEKIIMEEMVEFYKWYNSLDVVPTIKTMRSFFEEIRNDELEKIKNKVHDEDFAKIEDMTRRMIGRLLHNPTRNLKKFAETGTNINEVITNTIVLKELFNLENAPANGNSHIDNGNGNAEDKKE